MAKKTAAERALALVKELQEDFGSGFRGRRYSPRGYPGGEFGNGHNRVSEHVVQVLKYHGFPPK